MNDFSSLRVAFISGTLGQGGAEKQAAYIVRSLVKAGAHVRLYSLSQGEYYESILQALGVSPVWVGRYSYFVLRLLALAIALRDFRPHVIQSTHFYTNLYAVLLSSFYRAAGIGSIRNDAIYEMDANPFWGKWLLKGPNFLIANSYLAQSNAVLLGINQEKIHVLPNVINLVDFDAQSDKQLNVLDRSFSSRVVIMTIGRLVPAKRFDRFITALGLAYQKNKSILGLIVGDGPERMHLEAVARQENLSSDVLLFLGRRDDIPALLSQAHIFISTSDNEGFPNVILEAMAARLPVITMPAGDSDRVVQDNITGYVVPFDDVAKLASYMTMLAQSPELRRKLGLAGRDRVEKLYSIEHLTEKLMAIYSRIALQSQSRRLMEALSVK